MKNIRWPRSWREEGVRGSGDRISIRVLACSSWCSGNVTIRYAATIYACWPADRCLASCSTVYRSSIIVSPRDEIYYESKHTFREYVNVLLSRCCSFPSSLFNYASVPMFPARFSRNTDITRNFRHTMV